MVEGASRQKTRSLLTAASVASAPVASTLASPASTRDVVTKSIRAVLAGLSVL